MSIHIIQYVFLAKNLSKYVQIHGENLKLIGHVTSLIPCKDSNIVRYRNGQEKFEPEQ